MYNRKSSAKCRILFPAGLKEALKKMNMQKINYGLGRRDITPSMPVSLAGYFNTRMYTNILDRIECRAVVLRSEGKQFLLLQFDLLCVDSELYEKVRERIQDLKVFKADNILMTATHTHTAPDYRKSCLARNPDYMKFLLDQAEAAVREAVNDSREGTFSSTVTSDGRFLFNRRYWMKNGKVLTNPGKLNPEIDRPEGVTDPEIPMLAICNSYGAIQVLFANIVNHADTIGGTEVSADWPGFFRRSLEKDFGPESMVFPLIGASGNINHFDVSTERNQTCYEEARRIGLGYAETVRFTLETLQKIPSFKFKICAKAFDVAPAEVGAEELQVARETLEKYKDEPDIRTLKTDLTSEDLVSGKPAVLKYFAQNLLDIASHTDPFRCRLCGLDLGSVMIASLPGEPFTEIGLALRKKIFKDKICFVVTHSNGLSGYIPNVCCYGRGGYETEVRSNPYEHSFAEKLEQAWTEMSKELEFK